MGLDDWWNRVLFIDNGVEFTRNILLRCIADSDGGAHVDPEIKKEYFALTRLGSVGFNFSINGIEQTLSGPEILPHIGHEVVFSLKNYFRNYVRNMEYLIQSVKFEYDRGPADSHNHCQ